MKSPLIYILVCLVSLPICASYSLPEVLNTHTFLDSRSKFNSRAIYVEIEDEEFIIFEQINGINYKSVSLVITHFNAKTSTSLNKEPKILIQTNKVNSIIGVANNNILYFLEAESFGSKANIKKGELSKTGQLINIQNVYLDFELRGRSLPNLHQTGDMIYLVYRKSKCCGLGFASSYDGESFKKIDTFKKSGHMPVLNSFNEGSLIFSYQRSFKTDQLKDNGKPVFVMKSRFNISKDYGKSWGTEVLISESTFEIHDATFFKRRDGKLDIYYSHSLGREDNGLSLWRRCVNSDGALGVEELVANEEIGNIAKPNLFRKENGSIILLFIEQGNTIYGGSKQAFSIITKDSNCVLVQTRSYISP